MPEAFRVGVFTHDKLDAWVRFSSETRPTSPDPHSTVGIGLKLFGVPGATALGKTAIPRTSSSRALLD